MVKKIKKVVPLLRALQNATEEDRQALCKHLGVDGCEAVYECIHNAVHSKKLSAEERSGLKKELSPHKKAIRYLCKPGKNQKKKQKVLSQVGGSPLLMILSSVLPLISSLL